MIVVTRVSVLSERGKIRSVRRALLPWGRRSGRTFWWRKQKDPFCTILVEILLRQTKAATVEGPIAAFVSRHDSPTRLAKTRLSVLSRRLKSFGLHKQRAAQLKALGRRLVERGGEIPRGRLGLLQLPGVGPYTAAAVRCFAYGYRE